MAETPNPLTIKEWAIHDRPREKLINNGRKTLTDAELIAILIGSGNSSESALGLSRRLMASVSNNVSELSKLSIADLMHFKGIGTAKAVTIAAALELGYRRASAVSLSRKRISSAQTAYDILHPILGELPHEEFWILYLNNSNAVLDKHQLSKGGITGTVVDVRLALKMALSLGAVALILAHNHPSGTLKPSIADKALTAKLTKAAASLDIRVLDHLIVTEKAYFSFADEGLL